MERILPLKWSWTRLIARRTDEPPATRSRGRTPERWTNRIKKVAGTHTDKKGFKILAVADNLSPDNFNSYGK